MTNGDPEGWSFYLNLTLMIGSYLCSQFGRETILCRVQVAAFVKSCYCIMKQQVSTYSTHLENCSAAVVRTTQERECFSVYLKDYHKNYLYSLHTEL